MKDFLLFATLQFVSYLNLTVNFRAIAHEQYAFAVVTDGIACWLSYTAVRRIAGDKSRWGVAGLILGGSLAALVGIYLTRAWS